MSLLWKTNFTVPIDFQEFYILLYTYSLEQAKNVVSLGSRIIVALGSIRFLVPSICSRVWNRRGAGVLESTEGGES